MEARAKRKNKHNETKGIFKKKFILKMTSS